MCAQAPAILMLIRYHLLRIFVNTHFMIKCLVKLEQCMQLILATGGPPIHLQYHVQVGKLMLAQTVQSDGFKLNE